MKTWFGTRYFIISSSLCYSTKLQICYNTLKKYGVWKISLFYEKEGSIRDVQKSHKKKGVEDRVTFYTRPSGLSSRRSRRYVPTGATTPPLSEPPTKLVIN
jgi:hypothetical protein